MPGQTPKISNTKLVQLLQVYWAWRRLWLASTLLFAAASVAYCLTLKENVWIAAQGLIVRDEANGAVMRLGRFQSQTEMKAAQETILEMARNVQVVAAALRKVGPASGWINTSTEPIQAVPNTQWPSQTEVAEFAEKCIGVHAPQGAEFGTTEVIYIDVKEHDKARALAINLAVCESLDNRLREVRRARADGVIAELEHANRMAHAELARITAELEKVEKEAGADLADLRGLTDSASGGSTARVSLDAVKTELRQAENQHKQLLSDLKLLNSSSQDPDKVLSAPTSVLNAHPGLRKLREGLADLQLQISQLKGRFTENHPNVIATINGETEILSRVQKELILAIGAVNSDIENSQARIDLLRGQQEQLEDRLTRLAHIRANYGNIVNEVRTRTGIVQESERELAEARASRDAAMSTTLITRIDEPVISDRPIGPGKTTIVAASTVAGLMFGLGIVFLLTPLDSAPSTGRRWSDYGPAIGRRLTDRLPWLGEQAPRGTGPNRRSSDLRRRASDPTTSPSTQTSMSAAEIASLPPGTVITTSAPTVARRRSSDVSEGGPRQADPPTPIVTPEHFEKLDPAPFSIPPAVLHPVVSRPPRT